MPNKTEKDFWIEMAIKEIVTQAHFAGISYKNINSKVEVGTDLTFSSIHSFLSHCANVSKMLVANDGENPPTTIGDILGVSEESDIHNRRFRNHLEHYDERLKRWIRNKKNATVIGTYNVGPKEMFNASNKILVSHYDPSNNTFTFVNEDFDLGVLHRDVIRVKSLADNWVRKDEGHNP